jgi:5-methyltetrahydropteroyltriglutamate--homocysteine methyltransferase
MLRSTNRILTTHVGSLPRPPSLIPLLAANEEGKPTDRAAFESAVRAAVAETVQRQRDAGIDSLNDGEQSKPDYSTYVKHRFTGFEGETLPMEIGRDAAEHPDYRLGRMSGGSFTAFRPTCVGPIEWKDFAAVERDIANLKAASAGATEVFMTAVSPGQAARFLRNTYYKTDEAYLHALGAVLKDEYRAIADAGFIVQLDCPDLGSGWNNQFRDLDLPAFLKVVDMHIEVLNEATKDLAPEQMRLHLCWGNYDGPHTHDIPLKEILPGVLKSRAQGISFEGANPRHEHEWTVFKEIRLPEDRIIYPGVIDSTTNYVEHPEVVAQRIERYASVVGKENVVASVDCGFATFADRSEVFPSIAWAKLGALSEGARVASGRLW